MTVSIEPTSFPGFYRKLCAKIMKGPREVNSRTGVEIAMLANPASFSISLADERLPVVDNRRMFPHIAAAETAWQFLGTKDPEFILKHAPKLWSKFVEDGELKTAYGYRWRDHFGRDQLDMAVDQLRNNKTNRQLYISAWDPAADGLGEPNLPKNMPCPVGFSLTVVEDKLNMSVFIRSSDVFVGLPYDVMSYCLTLDAFAAEVNLKPGVAHFTLAHPHVYQPHFDFADPPELGERLYDAHIDQSKLKGAGSTVVNHQPVLPAWTITQILDDPDMYVRHVARLSKRVRKHDWNPLPEVIE